MPAPRPPEKAIWTVRRRELHDWLRTNAPPLAEAYEGAVELLGTPTFPSRIPLICHLVRDFLDRLPYALEPSTEGHRVPYEETMDKLAKIWPPSMSITRVDGTMQGDTVTISHQAAHMIDGLLNHHRERRSRPHSSELLIRALTRRLTTPAQVNLRLAEEIKEIHKWFVKRTHLRRDTTAKVDEKDLQAKFEYFEGIIHNFVGSFFTGTTDLDAILQDANQ